MNPDLTVGTQQAFTQPFGWYLGTSNSAAQDANNSKAIAIMEDAVAKVSSGK